MPVFMPTFPKITFMAPNKSHVWIYNIS